jgi:Arc/MetJ-type ribon-helix-helix transcriptional regulator
MSYAIPSDVQPKIDAILAAGKFANAADVIREAVDALAQREAFVAEVQASFDQLEAGGGMSLDDFEAELMERRAARRGE